MDALARAVALVWWTTPNLALCWEAGLPGAQVYLKDIQRRVALRIRHTSLHALQDGALDCPAPLLAPSLTTSSDIPVWNTRSASSFEDIIVFPDGSKLANRKAGSAYHGQQADRLLFSRHFSLDHTAEVYNAKIAAAARGAVDATQSPATYMAENVYVVLHSLAAARNLQPDRFPVLSPSPAAQIAAARRAWASRKRAPHIPEGEIKVWWILGRVGLGKNERADRLAELGAALSPSCPSPLP